MIDFINLCIADITFTITRQDTTILQDLDPNYNSFYSNAHEDPEKIDLYIYPELPDLWNSEKIKKIFDSGSSWTMFRNGTDYLIAIGSQDSPDCLARFNLSFKDVQIYNSDNENVIPAKAGIQRTKKLDSRLHGNDKLGVFSGERKIDGKKGIMNPFCYPLDRLLMMYILSKKEGAMLHAAGIIINGKGYIFPGSSGAGKSTLSRRFYSDKDSIVLTDERVVVRKFNGKTKVFGTPWPGEAGIAVNKSAPLSGIFFIHHGTENKIKEIKPGEALQRLLPVTSVPWYDPEIMTKILYFCEDLILHIPAYELYFKPDGEIIDFLKEVF